MDANDIMLTFSIFVTVCVIVWAILVIRAYNRIGNKD
ncbi:hypothetical protein C8N41_102695 [Winogradskyella sediminis]|nr:hypothetical protein C8N41_102695 [Winogradskyella sediminis]